MSLLDRTNVTPIPLRLETDPRPALPEVEDPSPEFRNVSSSVKFCKSSSRGRYSTAGRDVEAGEVLFVDQPLASFLAGTRWASNCGHCCRPLCYTLVPSPLTCDVIFCGIRCCVGAMKSGHVQESLHNLRQEASILLSYCTWAAVVSQW